MMNEKRFILLYIFLSNFYLYINVKVYIINYVSLSLDLFYIFEAQQLKLL